jgi:hypothetical protein
MGKRLRSNEETDFIVSEIAETQADVDKLCEANMAMLDTIKSLTAAVKVISDRVARLEMMLGKGGDE